MNPGAKHDTGKPQVYSVLRYFPRAIEAVARVSEHGARLHGWDTWHTIGDPVKRYQDAGLRHDLEVAKHGEAARDGESDLLHLSHKAWGALAVLELVLRDMAERDAMGEKRYGTRL